MCSVPTPPTPTGNTATLINDVFDQSSATINTISDFIATLADIGGGVGTVSLLVATVESLVSQGDIQGELASITTAIQNGFHQLGQDLGAAQILQRNTTISQNIFSPTGSYPILQGLGASVAALNAVPPQLTHGEVINQIEVCIGALDAFSSPIQPDIIWNLDYDWQVYWTDAGVYFQMIWGEGGDDGNSASPVDVGYGLQPPTKDPDGTPVGPGTTVFAYGFSLPTYLFAVSIFLATGLALDPQFTNNPSWVSVLK